jgi:hypothetical protein
LFEQLRGLRTSDPKAYWSLLNKGCDKSKTVTQKVALNVFFNHFKEMSNMQNDKIILKILTNTGGISLSAACFKNSLSIIPLPHALLFFKDLIASVTSFSEIDSFITVLYSLILSGKTISRLIGLY